MVNILTNVDGKQFDFSRSRIWLEQKTKELSDLGFNAEFRRNGLGSKPSAGITAEKARVGGYFTNWVTGETDFQVLDCDSGKSVVNRMCVIVDDLTFVETFQLFAAALKR